MQANISDFSYILCPGNMPDSSYKNYYEKIFECWNLVWRNAFTELGVQERLNSDAFTRQDFIGATFYKDQCIGMVFLRYVDAARADFKLDSYFKNWNEDHLTALCSRGNKILVSSNLTLHPMARGHNLGISGKDLIVGVTVEMFLNSNADAMTGAMRVDRGANTATLRWGATSIAERVPCDFGANNTELVGFFKDEVKKIPQTEMKDFVSQLWTKRIIISRIPFETAFLTEEHSTQKKLSVA